MIAAVPDADIPKVYNNSTGAGIHHFDTVFKKKRSDISINAWACEQVGTSARGKAH